VPREPARSLASLTPGAARCVGCPRASRLCVAEARGQPPVSGGGQSPAYTLAAALCGLGCAENVYLTVVKLSGAAPAFCASAGGGCGGVLSSSYAQLLGQPLTAFGAAAYLAVCATAASGALADASGAPGALNGARTPLLLGATALATVSTYLMTVLGTQLGGQLCPYCLASAALSAATLAAAVRGFSADELRSLGAPLTATAASVLLSIALPQTQAASQLAEREALDIPYAAPQARCTAPPFSRRHRSLRPQLSRTSTAGTRALAQHLSSAGVRMFGAFWCSHCEEQKELFGAGAPLPYVECFPEGYRKGVQMVDACKAQNLSGFPTWVFTDGTKARGVRCRLLRATG